MRFFSFLFGLMIIALFSTANAGEYLDPPHSNVPGFPEEECALCHNPNECWVCHKSTRKSPMDLTDRCHRCHGSEPSLYSATLASTHSSEVTASTRFSYYVECVHCHDPHRHLQNLMYGTTYGKYVEYIISADLDVVDFTEDPPLSVSKHISASIKFTNENEFDDGDDYYTEDICNTCHTQTNHHQSDGTAPGGQSHYDGTACTSCHSHANGFKPAGGDCVSCHAVPQDNGDGVPPGGRRAVVGEFPAANPHAHCGADLDAGACETCHSMATHQDGFVELIDPDSGDLYRFSDVGELTSDPDVSDFCAGCHDADGATQLASPFDPFGNGNSAPDVAQRFQGTLQWNEWYGDFCFGEEGTLRGVNSHHDISDTDQAFSGAKLECLNCHGAHSAAASQPLVDPFDTTVVWSGADDDFCLQCHGGGMSPSDPGFPQGVIGPAVSMRGIDSCDYNVSPWWVEYSWTNEAHGLDSKRGWPGYSGAPAQVVNCKDCHDPHGSYTAANPSGNPYMIRDWVDGTAYIDDGTRTGGFNGPPFETYGTATSVTVSISGNQVDWGGSSSLCVTCHSGWLVAYDWHSYCNGCQTCHGHGQSWGGADWGPSPSDATSCVDLASVAGSKSLALGEAEGGEPPAVHDSGKIQDQWVPGAANR